MVTGMDEIASHFSCLVIMGSTGILYVIFLDYFLVRLYKIMFLNKDHSRLWTNQNMTKLYAYLFFYIVWCGNLFRNYHKRRQLF